MNELETTSPKVERDKLGRILPGQESLNPNGRPVGSISIKDRLRNYLEENPDKMAEFVNYFAKESRELAWQMLEGKPPQDITSGGEKIQQVPIYGGLSNNNGDNKDIQPQEENTSS